MKVIEHPVILKLLLKSSSHFISVILMYYRVHKLLSLDYIIFAALCRFPVNSLTLKCGPDASLILILTTCVKDWHELLIIFAINKYY